MIHVGVSQIHEGGSFAEVEFTAMGSGSLAALSVLEVSMHGLRTRTKVSRSHFPQLHSCDLVWDARPTCVIFRLSTRQLRARFVVGEKLRAYHGNREQSLGEDMFVLA